MLVLTSQPERPFVELGLVQATAYPARKVLSLSLKSPAVLAQQDVLRQLEREATRLGANAIIGLRYVSSLGALTGYATAVFLQ